LINLFFILLLIALIGAGYYVYQRLLELEREIRAEQQVHVGAEESPAIAPGPASSTEVTGVSEKIIGAIEDSPGLAQTELYVKFPEKDRRELQKLLRELDSAGRLRREKKGNSYLLYPL
jgi:hypothetical protein